MRCAWPLHSAGSIGSFISIPTSYSSGPSPDALASHLAWLDNRGATTYNYANVEAAPESKATGSPFDQLTLFKQHIDSVPRTPEAARAGRYWSDKASYFLYHDLGKPACRVHAGARLLSPHEWYPAELEAAVCLTNMKPPLSLGHVASHHG